MNLIKLILLLSLCIKAFAQVNLNSEEKEWISKNPILKVGVDSNWPPFEYINNQKNYSGISSDYIKIISQKTGLKFDIYASDWTDIIGKAKNKELDILACAGKTTKRLTYLNFSQAYLDLDLLVVAKKDLILNSFNELNKYKVVLQRDNFIHDKLKEYFANKIEFVFVKSNEEAFKLLSYGKADIFIGNLPVISYFIEKFLLTNLEIKFKANLKKTNLSMGVSKDNTVLLSIINKVLDSIPLEQKDEINKKWIKIDFEKSKKQILSNEEKLWLNSQDTITIAGDPSWPPYSFYDDEGNYKGIVPDMIKEVFEQKNIKIKYLKTNTWDETLKLAKNKKVDLIDAISYTKKREKFLNFSSTYLGAELVIISNTSHDNYVDSFNSIANKKIATVKGYSIIDRIKKDYKNIKTIIEIDSPLMGLKELSNAQIDYFILDIPSFEFYSKTYGLSNLKIVGPSGYSYKYGFGINKDKEILLPIMNKLLNSLSEDKKFEIYRKWVKIDYEEKIDYELIKKIVLIFFILILGTFYWNRKLQKEIKHRQEIQKKLELSNEFNKAVMDSQADIVVIIKEKKIIDANKAFFEFFSYKNISEFKKEYQCISDFFSSSSLKYIDKNEQGEYWVDKVLSNSDDIFKALIYKNEKPFVFKLSASYISKDEDLKTVVFTDITQLENINELLIKAKNEALNISKQKSEFLANMSHEIRTPMNSVIGFTELLDKEINDPIQKDYLSSIKKGGQALLRIINDILDLSKIEAGKLEIKNEALNPSSLFMEIESIFHSKIISKNISFEIEIDKSIPKTIIIDGIRIRQILFNLIGNAIKFTQKGYIKLKVENLYKDKAKSKIDLIFYVEDSGIGIDEESLKYIFNAFEQQKGQDSAKYGGTGLGLAICKKLVEMMNGKIEVTSKKTKGTSFKVSIFDIPVSSISEEQELEKSFDFENIVFKKASILVVDDIAENRKLVEASLKDYNFNLIMAQDGKDAIEKLKNIKIDLILMDLRMPVMNGYEAATYIKGEKTLKDIPLLALTASVMGKDLEKVSEYGFDAYLRKPVILEDLIKELSVFLEYELKDEQLIKIKKSSKKLDKKLLDELLYELISFYKKEHKEIKDKGDFSLIEDFALRLKNLAIKKEVFILQEYAQDLLDHIEAFDIEKVDYLLNSFEKLISKLENKRNEFE